MLAGALMLLLAGCTPALNWRVVAVDATLAALFPCRAERRERAAVPIGTQRLTVVQWSCQADGMTFAINAVNVDDPAARSGVADALRAASLDNARGRIGRDEPWSAPAALAITGGRRVAVEGGRVDVAPDRMIELELLTFVRGSSAYQVAVVGERLKAGAVEAFVDGLAIPR